MTHSRRHPANPRGSGERQRQYNVRFFFRTRAVSSCAPETGASGARLSEVLVEGSILFRLNDTFLKRIVNLSCEMDANRLVTPTADGPEAQSESLTYH